VYPSLHYSQKYAEVIKHVASSGVRFWKAYEGEQATVKIFLGDPGDTRWLPGNHSGKVIDTVLVVAKIIKSRIAKNKLYWVPDPNIKHWSGYLAFILKSLLSPYRISAG
jgi:hypothetical protein